MTAYEFLVPFGLAENGRLVGRDEVEKGQRYRCPGCYTDLIVKAGDVRRRYLAHLANTACEPESLAHKTAKLLVARVVNDWKAGRGLVPVVERVCTRCNLPWRVPLPERISAAAVEVTVMNRWRVDVGLFQGDRVVVAVEILHTHRTDGEKAADLAIPWAELSAASILEEPLLWRLVGGMRLAKVCPACEQRVAELRDLEVKRQRALVALGERLNQPVLAGAYVTDSCSCWTCGNETLVYRWDGQPWASQPPPEPRPRTVKFRFSKALGYYYWVNTCGRCGWLQGDHYLFNDPDGVFYDGTHFEPYARRHGF